MSKPTDKECLLCKETFSIFGVHQYCVDKTWIHVCHGCTSNLVHEAAREELQGANHETA
jgi:hypothetical protein